MKKYTFARSVALLVGFSFGSQSALAEGLSHQVEDLDAAVADIYSSLSTLPPLAKHSVPELESQYTKQTYSERVFDANGTELPTNCPGRIQKFSRDVREDAVYTTVSLHRICNDTEVDIKFQWTLRTDETGTYFISGNIRDQQAVFDDAPIVFPAEMYLGIPYNSASTVTRNNGDGTTSRFFHMDTRVNTAIQNLTLSSGKQYTGCLKTVLHRVSTYWGDADRVKWRCPGFGFTKEYSKIPNDRFRIIELLSVE
jgi:hypothetical protein